MSNELQEFNGSILATQIFNDDGLFNKATKLAEMMATSKSMVPPHLRQAGDCLGVILDSWAWQLNPFAVARKTHVINNILGYEAQVIAAAINNSKEVEGSFEFEWFGDWSKVIGKFNVKTNKEGKEYREVGWKLADEEGIGVRVWATKKGESEPRVLELLLAQARVRNSTMWADDPKQQLAYLAQKKWARLHAPGVIMGAYSTDEIAEMEPKDITPKTDKGVYAQPGNTSPQENDLVKKEVTRLTKIAESQGIDAYKKAWESISAEMRKNIGAKNHEEMKAKANGVNIIDATAETVKQEDPETYYNNMASLINGSESVEMLNTCIQGLDRKILSESQLATLTELAGERLGMMS